MTNHKGLGRRVTAAACALVLAAALVACGNDDDEAPIAPGDEPTAVDPVDPQEDPGEGQTGVAPVDPGDAAVPPDLPASLPIPSGTDRTQELAPGSYISFVGQSAEAVIDEFEASLPAAGWTIVERVADVAARGDLMFTVEQDGVEATILVQPGDEPDYSSVLWEIPG